MKQFLKYNTRPCANIITGNGTWVHFYEPERKIQNKVWASKGSPCKAKRTMSVKMVMYVIFFTNQCPAIQIDVSLKAKFYKVKVLHKLKKYFKPSTSTGLRGVRLLHDNASSLKAVIVRTYLKQEKVVELPQPHYSPDLDSCDYFRG
jgi:histone-lysine N-methyltransferase SETMAR